MFDPDHPGPDYTLRWPRELFAREASALLQPSRIDADWQTDAEWAPRGRVRHDPAAR